MCLAGCRQVVLLLGTTPAGYRQLSGWVDVLLHAVFSFACLHTDGFQPVTSDVLLDGWLTAVLLLPYLQVVVHNLPWTCTWQQLKDCFREWKVERADIVEDQWGRSRSVSQCHNSTHWASWMASGGWHGMACGCTD
jgi:hypothetical protein